MSNQIFFSREGSISDCRLHVYVCACVCVCVHNLYINGMTAGGGWQELDMQRFLLDENKRYLALM